MSRTLHLYDLLPPALPRWVPGDQYPRAALRAMLKPFRGTPPVGLTKLVQNLTLGLDRLGAPYRFHRRPAKMAKGDLVGIVHGPIDTVREVAAQQPCITGVGVLNFPDEWPNLFKETQSAIHLQSCDWAADFYRPFYGDRVKIWAVGIDHDTYTPRPAVNKEFDFLLYNKIRWPKELPEPNLLTEIRATLARRGLTYTEIAYGKYPKGKENSYHAMLGRCRAMLFVCENETQGIAYNEAMSMGVPILAWNPLRWLDPERHKHNLSNHHASSVPYWDERCGEQFHNLAEFEPAMNRFLEGVRSNRYRPRDYVMDHFQLAKCAQNFIDFTAEAVDRKS